MSSISVVINTINSAQTLENTLKSVQSLGEIVVVDMHSDDETVEIAKKYHAKVYLHERVGYVEPARNYALGKAKNEWILVIDSDEEIRPELALILRDIAEGKRDNGKYTHYYFPRKNIIFGSWLSHSGWWPDEKMLFSKKAQ